MAQQRITFEWILEENRSDLWRSSESEGAPALLGLNSAEQRAVFSVLRGLVLLLFVVIAAAGAGMTPGERERREAQKGINYTLDLESEAWKRRDRGLYESLLDPDLGDDWDDAWHDHWRDGASHEAPFQATLLYVREADGYMQASVLTEQAPFEWWQTSRYREERFYRHTDQRWLRTVPSPVAWGETRQLETEHLRFVFYARDAAAVEGAAGKLEKAYAGMYHLLGLKGAPAGKQIIAVTPHPIGRWSSTVPQLEVTSPLLAQIPAEQSDADYLAYDIMGWFTYRVIRDATPSSGLRYLYRWPILVWGMRGWMRDELLDQPSPWHAEAVEVLHAAAPHFLPVGLKAITDVRSNARPSREEVILRYLAAESFMKFVVDTYGNEDLPQLMTGLIRYGSWNQIIPEVYNISVAEFEQAWNAHLIKEYELEDAVPE
jgi:hypothetical protein